MVYSTTLPAVSTRRTSLRREFDPEEIRDLKKRSSADLTIEGPTLAAHAFRHGLIDEVSTIVCPLSVGGGLRFLPEVKLDLELKLQRTFATGMVQLRYDVRPVTPP